MSVRISCAWEWFNAPIHATKQASCLENHFCWEPNIEIFCLYTSVALFKSMSSNFTIKTSWSKHSTMHIKSVRSYLGQYNAHMTIGRCHLANQRLPTIPVMVNLFRETITMTAQRKQLQLRNSYSILFQIKYVLFLDFKAYLFSNKTIIFMHL